MEATITLWTKLLIDVAQATSKLLGKGRGPSEHSDSQKINSPITVMSLKFQHFSKKLASKQNKLEVNSEKQRFESIIVFSFNYDHISNLYRLPAVDFFLRVAFASVVLSVHQSL